MPWFISDCLSTSLLLTLSLETMDACKTELKNLLEDVEFLPVTEVFLETIHESAKLVDLLIMLPHFLKIFL